MSERDEFEQWRGWVPGRKPDGRYSVCTIDDELKAWQARADLAAERELQLEDQVDYLRNANQELVEAIRLAWTDSDVRCSRSANKIETILAAHGSDSAERSEAAYDERNNNEQPPNGD